MAAAMAKVPASILKAVQSLSGTIESMYAKALGGLLSRDVKQANEAIHISEGLAQKEQDLVKLVLKEVEDPKVILPLRGIYTNILTIGEYAQAIAVIAFNRYLEKPSGLCRPSSVPEAKLAVPAD